MYGPLPYTVQNGGCGDRGDLIHVAPEYLENIEYLDNIIGPKGNVFVHEWAKFRYGVFEEYGYPGDPIYPLFYPESEYTSAGYVDIPTPNFCTNEQIKGKAM